MKFIEELEKAVKHGFIDAESDHLLEHAPRFIRNDVRTSEKVVHTLSDLISNCDEFWFSVAFVTKSGVMSLMQSLDSLQKAGVHGSIFVSDYLNFTDPNALKQLQQMDVLEARILRGEKFHGKGYLFKRGEQYDLLVGSSNLTETALSVNDELNLLLTVNEDGQVVKDYLDLFKFSFERAHTLSDELLEQYVNERSRKRWFGGATDPVEAPVLPWHDSTPFVPNSLQQNALNELSLIREQGRERAIVVSATGTGKTVLAGFDAVQSEAKTLLFVVHRENIARRAMQTFKRIFDERDKNQPAVSMGLYSGGTYAENADFVFATLQTLSRASHLKKFPPEYFDYIIIDEAHRVAANSYKKILNHFTPQFLLGMTATPERTDGQEVFERFDNQVACDIRLEDALREDVVAPFHYFGIADIEINGELIDDESAFNSLVTKERVKHILDNLKKYGSDNGIRKGLIFCTSIEEATELSSQLNDKGLRTLPITGKTPVLLREEAIKRLEIDSGDEKLDYLLSVDVFNEGIDIPGINQIIMLRPTQSPIVFVQQLGRGLRKAENKAYLTVIDFIGNYTNNYMIPIALYGLNRLDKEEMRRKLRSDKALIPGASTINFDPVAMEHIHRSLNKANFLKLKDLKEAYSYLRLIIGRRPMMMDFVKHNRRDPWAFVEYGTCKSYYSFLRKVDGDDMPSMLVANEQLLQFLTWEVNNGKRLIESIILQSLIDRPKISVQDLQTTHKSLIGLRLDDKTLKSALHNLNLRFIKDQRAKKLIGEVHNYEIVDKTDNKIVAGTTLVKALEDPIFKEFLADSIEYSFHRFSTALNEAKGVISHGFIRYSRYTRKDIFRILNWPTNPVGLNVGGYQLGKDTIDCALFVSYDKSTNEIATQQYEDALIEPHLLKWMTKNNRTLQSPEVKAIMGQRENGLYIPLFVKKYKNEESFYYLGDLTYEPDSAENAVIKNQLGEEKPLVSMRFSLDAPVEATLYKYLTSGEKGNQSS